jgi:hypothetical protein
MLRDGAELLLEPEQCEAIEARAAQAKGDDRPLTREELRARRIAEQIEQQRISDTQAEYVVVEIGFGLGASQQDTRYVQTLEDFGFKLSNGMPLRASVGLGYRLLPHLVLGLNYYNLEERSGSREGNLDQKISWAGHALNVYAQGDLSFGRRRMLTLFARLGVGLSLAWTRFDAVPVQSLFPDQSPALEATSSATERVKQNYIRPAGFLGFGVQIMPGRFLGFQAELRWVLAQAIENSFGDKHDLGGLNIVFSVRARTWE